MKGCDPVQARMGAEGSVICGRFFRWKHRRDDEMSCCDGGRCAARSARGRWHGRRRKWDKGWEEEPKMSRLRQRFFVFPPWQSFLPLKIKDSYLITVLSSSSFCFFPPFFSTLSILAPYCQNVLVRLKDCFFVPFLLGFLSELSLFSDYFLNLKKGTKKREAFFCFFFSTLLLLSFPKFFCHCL